MTTNPFLELQAAVVERLRTDPILRELPIISETVGDIDAAVADALAKGGATEDRRGQPGLALLVLTPKARASGETAVALAALDVTVRVAAFENVPINRSPQGTGRPALDAIWNAITVMQGWAIHRGTTPASLVEMDSDSDPDGTLAYYVDFRFRRAFALSPVD